MKELNAVGLQELSTHQMKSTNGGLILAHYRKLLDAFNYAYTEFKKGVDDGYNNE